MVNLGFLELVQKLFLHLVAEKNNPINLFSLIIDNHLSPQDVNELYQRLKLKGRGKLKVPGEQ